PSRHGGPHPDPGRRTRRRSVPDLLDRVGRDPGAPNLPRHRPLVLRPGSNPPPVATPARSGRSGLRGAGPTGRRRAALDRPGRGFLRDLRRAPPPYWERARPFHPSTTAALDPGPGRAAGVRRDAEREQRRGKPDAVISWKRSA